MADTDPAATLHALADYFRKYDEITTLGGVIAPEFRALAEHVEGVAQRHTPGDWPGLRGVPGCNWCSSSEYKEAWPCLDVRELLAVAAATGVTP